MTRFANDLTGRPRYVTSGKGESCYFKRERINETHLSGSHQKTKPTRLEGGTIIVCGPTINISFFNYNRSFVSSTSFFIWPSAPLCRSDRVVLCVRLGLQMENYCALFVVWGSFLSFYRPTLPLFFWTWYSSITFSLGKTYSHILNKSQFLWPCSEVRFVAFSRMGKRKYCTDRGHNGFSVTTHPTITPRRATSSVPSTILGPTPTTRS